jgi:hypothetical protein
MLGTYLIDLKYPTSATSLLDVVMALALNCSIHWYRHHTQVVAHTV